MATPAATHRPGQVVGLENGVNVVLLDRAWPSGWWAVEAGLRSAARPFRVLSSRRSGDAGPVWRQVL